MMRLRSSAFSNDGKIPDEYSCHGVNVSPPLSWDGAPEGVGAYALVVEDPDASGGTYDHWVLFNIPAESSELPERVPHDPRLDDGSLQGANSSGKIGYTGPCPPSGDHRYIFRLFALDGKLDLASGVKKKKLLDAMDGRVLSEADLIGHYASR